MKSTRHSKTKKEVGPMGREDALPQTLTKSYFQVKLQRMESVLDQLKHF